MNKPFAFTLVLLSLAAFALCTGCGGNGGGSASSGPFSGGIVPVRITQEGANDRDGLFAFAGGDGVTGGWVENAQGTRISDALRLNNYLMRYESTLIGGKNSFNIGNYILKYTQGGDTKSMSVENVSWTLLSNFAATPWLEYDGRQAAIHYDPLPGGGDVKYFMRLLDSSTNYVYYESIANTYSAVIRESITARTGRWEIHLIADAYEGGVLKKRNIHVFPDVFS